MLGEIERGLLAVLLLVLMAGMGATLSMADFAAVIRRPKGLVIGIASQFGWMPLIAYACVRGFGLPADLGVGLVVLGCCPGGTTSNLFSYYAGADVALSVTMTIVSTLLATVMTPSLIYVYGRVFHAEFVSIPYGNIAGTLAVMIVPLAIGLVLRSRRPMVAAWVERAGSYSGPMIIGLILVTSLVRNQNLFAQVPMVGYLAAGLLGIAGVALGWLAASVAGLPVPSQHAVALETGIQNGPLALAILLSGFPVERDSRLLWLPMLYALFVLIQGTIVTFAIRCRPTAGTDAGNRTVPSDRG